MSVRKPTAPPDMCECHGKPHKECPRNRMRKITRKEQSEATVEFMKTWRGAQLGPEWLMCRCAQGPQPAHQAHKDCL